MEYEYTEIDIFSDEEIYTDTETQQSALTVEEVDALLSTPNTDTTVADVLSGCAAAII